MNEGIFAMWIALVAIIGSFAVVFGIIYISIRARQQRNQMLHQERMLAIEKGLPIPPDYLERQPRRRPYIRGLVWTSLGLGLMVFGWINAQRDGDWDLLGVGVVLLCVGAALLIGDRLTMKKSNGWEASTLPYPAAEVDRPVMENRS